VLEHWSVLSPTPSLSLSCDSVGSFGKASLSSGTPSSSLSKPPLELLEDELDDELELDELELELLDALLDELDEDEEVELVLDELELLEELEAPELDDDDELEELELEDELEEDISAVSTTTAETVAPSTLAVNSIVNPPSDTSTPFATMSNATLPPTMSKISRSSITGLPSTATSNTRAPASLQKSSAIFSMTS